MVDFSKMLDDFNDQDTSDRDLVASLIGDLENRQLKSSVSTHVNSLKNKKLSSNQLNLLKKQATASKRDDLDNFNSQLTREQQKLVEQGSRLVTGERRRQSQSLDNAVQIKRVEKSRAAQAVEQLVPRTVQLNNRQEITSNQYKSGINVNIINQDLLERDFLFRTNHLLNGDVLLDILNQTYQDFVERNPDFSLFGSSKARDKKQSMLLTALKFLPGFLVSYLSKALSGLATLFGKGLRSIWKPIGKVISQIFNFVKRIAGKAFDLAKTVASTVSRIFNNVFEKIKNILEPIRQTVSTALSKLKARFQSVIGKFKTIFYRFKDTFSTTLSKISYHFNKAKSAFSAIFGKLKSGVGKATTIINNVGKVVRSIGLNGTKIVAAGTKVIPALAALDVARQGLTGFRDVSNNGILNTGNSYARQAASGSVIDNVVGLLNPMKAAFHVEALVGKALRKLKPDQLISKMAQSLANIRQSSCSTCPLAEKLASRNQNVRRDNVIQTSYRTDGNTIPFVRY